MAATLTFNPLITTNVGTAAFNITTAGFIAGTATDNPAARNFLSGGFLASTETLPMWGGVAISEYLATKSTTLPIKELGPSISRATSVASTIPITGFSVFDQVHSAINFPQSPVPLIPTGGMVNFYRLGSGARIKVACDPTLVNMEGGLINQNVSWDFNDSILQPYVASGATEAVTSMTWSTTNGGQVAVVMTSAAIYAKVGDIINVSGVTNTGTGAVALINTAQTINTWTDSTHFTFLLPGTATLWGTFGGTIVLNVGVVALNSIGIQVLEVQIGNSMTVNYNASNQFATWNFAASAALILLQ
jgi:hypothetical protein